MLLRQLLTLNPVEYLLTTRENLLKNSQNE